MKKNDVLKLGGKNIEIPINPIRYARMDCGLTQQEMSDLLGIPKRTIEDWEAGRRNCPDYVEKLVLDKLNQLCKTNRESGQWKKHGNEKECSLCEFIYYSNNDDFNYCPNCGAKMYK